MRFGDEKNETYFLKKKPPLVETKLPHDFLKFSVRSFKVVKVKGHSRMNLEIYMYTKQGKFGLKSVVYKLQIKSTV